MPKYFYTAKSLQGENKSGELEAKDERQLARTLREQGLILVRAESKTKPKRGLNASFSFFGPSTTDKMFFTRNLQVMISSGLPLPRALEALASQAENQKFKKAISEIREKIMKGQNFSDALAGYPDIFSLLFQSMIRVGEEGGKMEDSLKMLSLQLERENDLRSKVTSAMIYPAVVLAAMAGVGVLMLIAVVPKLAATFEELNIDLPITTQIIINLAEFLTQKWYLAVIIAAFLVFLFRQILRSPIGKKIFGQILLKIPVFSQIVKNTNSAFTARTLSSLISAGVSLPKALEITAGTLGNVYYKAALLAAIEKVKKGEKLSEALRNYRALYPETLIQMIGVGEETGETSSILQKIADFYEDEVTNATKNLTSVIEPVLMIIIGAVIGFFAISMIQPMYSMLGSIE